MLAVALIDIRVVWHSTYWLYGAALALLVSVDILGHTAMGAQRWFRLGMVNVQPSEIMKLGVIGALARYFHPLYPEQLRYVVRLIIPVLSVLIPLICILRQPNLGTALLTAGTSAAIFYVAGVRAWKFGGVAACVAAAVPVLWQHMHDYQRKRVMTFLAPDADPLGAGYNILQSMIAIGAGGLWGKGYLQGSQGQLDFLPEQHTDFIFTLIAEEWGFAGGAVVIGLYILVIFDMIGVALACRHAFGRYLVFGIATLVFLHVLVNLGMVMALLPVVGIPLPFLSYGGSVLLSTLLGCGIVLNVHVHRDATW
jgi:rod shape determining protein RodA